MMHESRAVGAVGLNSRWFFDFLTSDQDDLVELDRESCPSLEHSFFSRWCPEIDSYPSTQKQNSNSKFRPSYSWWKEVFITSWKNWGRITSQILPLFPVRLRQLFYFTSGAPCRDFGETSSSMVIVPIVYRIMRFMLLRSVAFEGSGAFWFGAVCSFRTHVRSSLSISKRPNHGLCWAPYLLFTWQWLFMSSI